MRPGWEGTRKETRQPRSRRRAKGRAVPQLSGEGKLSHAIQR